MRVREVELVNMNPKPDFSPAPSIPGSPLPFPLKSLLFTSRNALRKWQAYIFSKYPQKEHDIGF